MVSIESTDDLTNKRSVDLHNPISAPVIAHSQSQTLCITNQIKKESDS
jgi:hypothetical protein